MYHVPPFSSALEQSIFPPSQKINDRESPLFIAVHSSF